MDQPQASGEANKIWDWVITGFVGLAGIVGGWLTTRTKANAEVESKGIETAPSIQKENIEWSEGLITKWEHEMQRLREEMTVVRKEAREDVEKERIRADEWRDRAMFCEARVPLLEMQIDQLRAKVADLERQVNQYRQETRGHSANAQ